MQEPGMAMCLVLHDLAGVPAAAEKAFFEAIFEIAAEHWRVTPGAVLVGSGVSPGYLRDHLLRALATQDSVPALLLVTRVAGDLAWMGLPPEGETWLREALE
jgi:hypothetical protein